MRAPKYERTAFQVAMVLIQLPQTARSGTARANLAPYSRAQQLIRTLL